MKTYPKDSSASRAAAIEATAAAWLAECDAGLSSDDAACFARWRAADPRHEAAVVRLQSAWGALQQLREFRPEAQRHPDADLLKPRAQPRPRLLPVLLAAGALAAGLALVAVWRWPHLGAPAGVPGARHHYATTVGGYQRVTLPDGSVMDLNANTAIEERFVAAERRVTLVRGEATFQVAKDPARPFVVRAAGVSVRAVGTAFNVRLHSEQVDVLVTEGRVRVEAPTTAPVAAVAEVGMGERLVVPTTPAVVASVALAATPVPAARISEELGWREPRLVFLETPLGEVVRQFNSRNRLQLELADPELATLPVGGSFRADQVDSFVRLLTSGGQIRVEVLDDVRLRLHRGP